MSKTRHPPELLAGAKSGRLVPFVGAGMSIPCGGPSWAKLRDQIIAQMGVDLGTGALENRLRAALSSSDPSLLTEAVRTIASVQDPLMVADIYEKKVGRPGVIDLLNLGLKGLSGPSESHRLLTKIPARAWVTTNYDNLLEAALNDEAVEYRHVLREEDIAYVDSTPMPLIKMHGSLIEPFLPDTVVFSRSDYEAYELKHPNLHLYLEFLMSTCPVLFLGYSVSDPNFRHLYNRVRHRMKRHQRFHFLVAFDMPEPVQHYWQTYGIRTVVLDGKDKEASMQEWLTEFVAAL